MYWKAGGGGSLEPEGGEPRSGRHLSAKASRPSPLDSASCCCNLPKADCHPSRALKDQVLWSLVQSMAERIHILVHHGQVSTMASQLCLGDGSCTVWWHLGPTPVGGGGCFQKREGPLLPKKGGCSHSLWNSVN